MKEVIYKYAFKNYGTNAVEMPKGADILSVHIQYELPTIWALCDPNNEPEGRIIEIFRTGGEVPCDMGIERKFIGTCLLQNGAKVCHVFERIN